MCGIAGIVGYRDPAAAVDDAELLRIRDAMAARGPDGAGLWTSPDRRAALAHRRLAIIDLTDLGAQPMRSADGRFVIAFNGEIYNYRALREELVREGAALRSTSDTEVLVELYARHGAAMLPRLRGMYALAIWDERERRLFLARDPFGVKPLYYADDGSAFRFASQVRALLAGGAVDRTPDPAGHAGFWTFGFVPEPFTLYRQVRSLPAGSSLTVDARGSTTAVKFFDVAQEYRRAEDLVANVDAEEARSRLAEALEDSVVHHMVADVPVGVFLSAGIDSTLLATLAARRSAHEVRCITLGFREHEGGALDETVLASRTAHALGARHAIEWLGREDFYAEIGDVAAAMDQPTTDGINTYFVARAAARQGLKVALSGLGGDELFLGYPSYSHVPAMVRTLGFANRLPARVRCAVRAIAAPLAGRVVSPKYAGLLEYGGTYEGAYLLRRGLYMPWELEELLGPKAAREGWERLNALSALAAAREGLRHDASIVSALEISWYMRGQLLRDADWAGMAHSIEIRVPFVDVEVLRAAAPLVESGAVRGKRDVAALPAFGLPREVLDRPKTGFRVPVREWIAQAGTRRRDRGLRGWARHVARHFAGRRSLLALATDAFGSPGGIALYMRDFLAAAAGDPSTARLLALPRNAPETTQALPAKLRIDHSGAGGKLRYVAAVARTLLSRERFDVVVCGHLNLMPLAALAAAISHAPLVLLTYGVDAWRPTRSALANLLVRRVDAVVCISRITSERFLAWSGVRADRCTIVPNAIHRERYGPGPRPRELAERYGIGGRKVIMSLGRLAADERYKGIDEVLEAMPRLAELVPDLAYLVVGEGTDRARLEAKAGELGLEGRVVFTGHIDESEKADHYRLADAFVMPSSGEGFGFVFLEAMACGVPVVASATDGGREALRDGRLGRLVDPADREGLVRAIREALDSPRQVPPGLEHFDFANFERRCRRLLERTCLLW